MSSQLFRQLVRISTMLVLSILVVVGTAAASAEKDDKGRSAILAANNLHSKSSMESMADVCLVPSDAYKSIQAALDDLACATISLAESLFKENLVIDRTVSIEGSGPAESIIIGRRLGSVIHINQDANATLSELTITKGRSDFGGGIFNSGQVLLKGVVISNNVSNKNGAGMLNQGKATFYNSTIIYNTAHDSDGGGLRNEGQMYINNSTIALNVGVFSGGGISNDDAGELWIYSSTITANKAFIGGGLIGNDQGDGKITLTNTLVSDNLPSDCARRIVSNGYNLVAAPESCTFESKATDILGMAAYLGEREGLPDYYPLTSLSPAIDSGNPAGCVDHQGNLLLTDQRGVVRDSLCDIGAVEFDGEFNRSYFPVVMHNGCFGFFDDFSDPGSGWTISDNEHVETGYINSEYRIFVKDPTFYFLYLSPACPRDYYTVEVDARWQGAPGAAYGLAFAADADLDTFHMFEVNAERQVYRMLYIHDGEVTEITPVRFSSAIKKDGEWNNLEVRWENNLVVATVNGTQIEAVTITNSAHPTYAGVLAVSYAKQQQSEARFDNFNIVNMNGASATEGLTKTTSRASQDTYFMRLPPLYRPPTE